jgi:hypothetical protein
MMKKWSALSILSLLTLPVWASPSMQRVTSETIVSSTAPESCIKTLDRAAGFQLPAAKTLCPTVALSGSLAFAEVGIGLTQGSNLVIQNTGTGPLVVSSIRYPAGFSGDWSGSIAEGQSHTIVVSFSPSQKIWRSFDSQQQCTSGREYLSRFRQGCSAATHAAS